MLIPILVSAFTGTVVMTAFSYIVSRIEGKQYREPELLAYMFKKVIPVKLDEKWDLFAGFFAHYLAGVGFMVAYYLLWEYSGLSPGFWFGVIGGFINGFVGIAIWQMTFLFHPEPPRIDYIGYYIQLVVAHIFFGVTATLTYMWFN